MFSTDELKAALQNGTNPDDIAKSFTEALNAAIKAQKEADERAAKDKVRAERVAALQDIVDEIADFVELFYPDMYEEAIFDSFDAKALDKAITDAYDEVKRMTPIFESLKDLEKQLKMTDNINKPIFKDPTINSVKSTDQAIADFLRKSGL